MMLSEIERMADYYVDRKMTFSLRETVLEALNIERNPKIVHAVFLETYKSVKYPPSDFFRSLFICTAINRGRDDVADLALENAEKKYNVNFKQGYSSPLPLVVATRMCKYDLIEKMLRMRAWVSLPGNGNEDATGTVTSALEVAFNMDDVIAFRLMKNYRSEAPPLLELAAQHGAYKCAEECLRDNPLAVNGCRLSSRYSETPTPLVYAIQRKDRSMVDLLLSAGASVNFTNSDAYTAMHYAADVPYNIIGQMDDIIKDLIAHLSDMNAVTCSGETPLSLFIGRMLKWPNCETVNRGFDTGHLQAFISRGCLLNPLKGKCALEACYSHFTTCLFHRIGSDVVPFLQWFDDLLTFLFSQGASFTGWDSSFVTINTILQGLSEIGTRLLAKSDSTRKSKQLTDSIFIRLLCSHDRLPFNDGICGYLTQSSVLSRRCALMYLEMLPHAAFDFSLQLYISHHEEHSAQVLPRRCRTLKICCRAAILKCLQGERLLTDVARLPLPASVITFVKYGSCVNLDYCNDD